MLIFASSNSYADETSRPKSGIFHARNIKKQPITAPRGDTETPPRIA